MRHWDKMRLDGTYWCGEFETDDVDWHLAELIVNIQYACQRHYFGAMAEAYFDNKLRDASVNLRRNQKTVDSFNRLPEEFTVDDVMRCFSFKAESSARTKIVRLMADNLVEKASEVKVDGVTLQRSIWCLGIIIICVIMKQVEMNQNSRLTPHLALPSEAALSHLSELNGLRLSPHFKLGELCKTKYVTADGNIPSRAVIENLIRVCGWLEGIFLREP